MVDPSSSMRTCALPEIPSKASSLVVEYSSSIAPTPSLTEVKDISAWEVGVQVSGSEAEAVAFERNSTRFSTCRQCSRVWMVVIFGKVKLVFWDVAIARRPSRPTDT